MCCGPRRAANSMAYSYWHIGLRMRRKIACKQSGSETGHDTSSTHDSITSDVWNGCKPFTTSVGNGDDGLDIVTACLMKLMLNHWFHSLNLSFHYDSAGDGKLWEANGARQSFGSSDMIRTVSSLRPTARKRTCNSPAGTDARAMHTTSAFISRLLVY